jgi:hypothetical protein
MSRLESEMQMQAIGQAQAASVAATASMYPAGVRYPTVQLFPPFMASSMPYVGTMPPMEFGLYPQGRTPQVMYTPQGERAVFLPGPQNAAYFSEGFPATVAANPMMAMGPPMGITSMPPAIMMSPSAAAAATSPAGMYPPFSIQVPQPPALTGATVTASSSAPETGDSSESSDQEKTKKPNAKKKRARRQKLPVEKEDKSDDEVGSESDAQVLKKKRKSDGDTKIDHEHSESFAEKLHHLLTDSESEGLHHIASFTPSGNVRTTLPSTDLVALS